MSRRRQSPLPAVAAILLAVALTVSLFANWSLATTGEFKIPGFDQPIVIAKDKKAEEAAKVVPDTIGVLVPARNLAAFHLVTQEDFYKEDGTLSVQQVGKSSLDGSDMITEPRLAIGRVLLRAKTKGTLFHPNDFFPIGTQSGLSAGVPEGMVGTSVDCSRVSGLEGLVLGDLVDLMASTIIEPINTDLSEADRTKVETEQMLRGLDRQAQIKRIAERALVVQSVVQREVPGSKVKINEVYIALLPEESSALHAALARGDAIYANARSGRIGDDGSVQIPEVVPTDPNAPRSDLVPPYVVESITGGARTSTEVPRTQP